jgi:hypothetical protein
MQQTTGVAVLATHLAQTDRRALSQAWYDALHLAGTTPAPQRGAAPPPIDAPPTLVRNAHAGASPCAADGPVAPRERRTGAALRDLAPLALERRAPKSELARRIERALAQHVPRAIPASFAVDAAGGRIRILVRTDGERTRILAVCTPPLRERVERALAQARFALASRGIRADAG